jgi:uncharacterized protein (TIGR00725 family)
LNSNKPVIAVIGASKAGAKELAAAEEVGRLIARSGAILVCGGMGGVMEAACRGASAGGGLTIGILPGENGQAANEFVHISIATGVGYARNLAVVRSARAVIAVGGSYGTLSEIAYALQGSLPVIGLDTWRISRNGKFDKAIVPAENPEDAVGKALQMIGETWQKK